MSKDDDGLRYLADTLNGIVRATFWFRIWASVIIFTVYFGFLYLAISGKLERWFF